ncbi:MAG: 3,4-dihydroxy-2-butanone-4-phosphate synthase, partial [Deltaproteobacteria bacterium]
MAVSPIEDVIEDIKAGKMIILVDDEDRENEGDLCMAAETVTPEAINFMATYGRGLICLTLSGDIVDQLQLPMMVSDNQSPFGTGFTVSIEARTGVATGISAADRARTVQAAVAPDATPYDIISPGHIFPLRAKDGGVLVRTGQTEGSIDLARLAQMRTAGVICEIMKDDGTMARMPDLEIFSQKHDIKIATIADLVAYRIRRDVLVHRAAEARVPTEHAEEFTAIVYTNDVDQMEHMALVKGEINPDKPVLV